MAKVQYVGKSHFRELSKADLDQIGHPDGRKTVWDRDAKDAHELSDDAASWLESNEKGDWKIIKDGEVADIKPVTNNPEIPSEARPTTPTVTPPTV